MKKNNIIDLSVAALCVALGILIPSVFHLFGQAGAVFCPMHIPVIVCGMVCGWKYGGLCGLIVPPLSFLIIGMPPIYPMGVSMMLELCAYGVLAGLLYKRFNVFVSLIGAMIGGRVVYGIVNLILMGIASTAYSMEAFLTGAFVTALPGIVIQLIFIPALVVLLEQLGFLKKKQKAKIAE